MSNDLLQRVQHSLNKQCYTMNYSWLSDCVDFYANDHPHATQEEITAFVMNQWTLYDLREINNENGCLPRNLSNQKCTTLPGKYILQVNKMYDISTSKYKQLEKIRNVSSDNIEATENENKIQEDKFQTWEPKSKRMLQLFLTDGIQDVLAIEYKTIRFLKDDLLPGYKLMIKGPVICRKGVILLEENNIAEVGGEVDNLLVNNALENVLARALNLDENPDPYNDKNRPIQSNTNTQKTAQLDDDFDIDSEAIDEIDKQIQQGVNASKNTTTSNLSNKLNLSFNTNEFNYSYQTPSVSNQTQRSNASSTKNQLSNSRNTLNNQKNKTQQNDKVEKMISGFDDDGDSFLEMVDDSEFKTPSVVKVSTLQNNLVTTVSKSRDDEFPNDDEIYDVADNHSPFFTSPKPKSQSTITKISSQKNDFPGSATLSYKCTSKITPQTKSNVVATPSVSDIDNFDFNDIDVDLNVFEDDFNMKTQDNLKNSKSTEAFISNSPKVKSQMLLSERSPFKFSSKSTKSMASSSETYFENEFEEDFYERCKTKLLTDKSSQDSVKSLSKLKNEEPLNKYNPSSEVTKNSSVKLSDKLKLDKDYYSTNSKIIDDNCRTSQMLSGSLFKSDNADTATKNSAFQTNKNTSTKTKFGSQNAYENLSVDFEHDFDTKFEAKMELEHKPIAQQTVKDTFKLDKKYNIGYSAPKPQDSVGNNFDTKSTGSKRSASPSASNRQKLRCVESTPNDKTNSRKITDFFDKPKPKLLNEYFPIYEAICDVLENLRKKDVILSIVRGKVVNVVKLNLLKGENGSYFHLEGTITDNTANLDVVFSSEVIEEIVGYSTREFILKRKRAKADPSIKDELRDDLKKAQGILRVMDALMEIEVKKNEKTTILAIKPMTKDERKQADERLERYKMEKK